MMKALEIMDPKHLYSSLSLIDILCALFSSFAFDKEDILLLSKGHAVASLYAYLFSEGYIFFHR